MASSDGWLVTAESEGEWGEYRRVILQELQRLHDGIADVKGQIALLHTSEIATIKAEIAVLKVKAVMWGAVASILFSAAVTFILNMALHK